jgi:lipoprotein-anchoring transpeptidase ErfK/SrfK
MNRPELTRRSALGLVAAALLAPAPSAEAGEPFPIRSVDRSELRADLRRQIVRSPYREAPGTIVVDTGRRLLHLIEIDGTSIRYGVAVGRAGFAWAGTAEIARKARWPAWTPTDSMAGGHPEVSYTLDGGPGNPLGARALYLYAGGRDTYCRLHGGGDIRSIGRAVSSGCIRLLDQDIVDLYERVGIGTRVVVLAG